MADDKRGASDDPWIRSLLAELAEGEASSPAPVEGIVIDRRPVASAPQASPAPVVEVVVEVEVSADANPPAAKAAASLVDYVSALQRFNDVVSRLSPLVAEELRVEAGSKFIPWQVDALVGLGRVLGFKIDISQLPRYEDDSTPHEEPPHVVTPEKQQQTVRELADNLEDVPGKAILRAVEHNAIRVDATEARRFAAVYKAVRDGEPVPPGTDKAEVELARQVVKAVKRDNESQRRYDRKQRERDREAYNASAAARVRDWRERKRGEAAGQQR